MVCLDGFTLSHTMENVLTLSDEAVRDFVGERPYIKVEGHLGEAEFRLDPEKPLTMGPLDLYDFYFEHKMHQVEAMKKALKAIPEIDEEYAEISGREYRLLHPYMMEDAEVALIGLGSTMGTVRYVVDRMRRRGLKVGMVRMRVFRPFPTEELKELLKDVEVVGVLDKAMSFGAPGGPLYEELRTIFYDVDENPIIVNYIYGLGGRDTPPHLIEEAYEELLEVKRRGEAVEKLKFLGVRM